MKTLRVRSRRVLLASLWCGIVSGGVVGGAFVAAACWIDRNTVVVHVVDPRGGPVANAVVVNGVFAFT